MLNKLLLFLFILLQHHTIQAQNKKVLDSLLYLYNNIKQDTSKIIVLTAIAFEYRGNKPDTTITIAQKALTQSEKIGFEKGKAWAWNRIGLAQNTKGKYAEAIISHQKALFIFEKISYKKGIATSLGDMGVIYYYQGNYPLALEYYQKSLKIREDMKEEKELSANLNNIGIIYKNQGNYDLALEYHQKSLKIYEKYNDKANISNSLQNIGNIYGYQKNYPLALECFQKGLKIQESIGNKRGITITLTSIANVQESLGNYPLAIEYFQKSIQIAEENDDKWALTYPLNNIALIYTKQEAYPKSIEYAQKSLQLAQEIKSPARIKDASNTLYKAYKLKGDYVKALEYHELYKQTNDSLFNIEKSKKIANLEATVEIERKQKKIEMLDKDLSLQKNAQTILEKQAEADRLFILAQNEKNKHKQDSLLLLAQAKQWEIDKHRVQEENFKIESAKKQIELSKEIEAKEHQQKISYLIILCFFLALALAVYMYQSRQKIFIAKHLIENQKEALVAQSEKLTKANETQKKLFAILGHDLRSPIGTLEGVLGLVSSGDISQEEFQNFAPQFHKNVKNIQNTLENLLHWSISQMEGMVSYPAPLALWKIVEDKILLFAEIAHSKKITISSNLPTELRAWADENHVRLLLRNLLNNAIKFTPEAGKIVVSARKDGAKIVIQVMDNGVGMSQEQVAKLFKKNSYFITSGTNGEKGTGLGLQLCQEIVTKNNGEIWVESEKGKGSTFSFSLPIDAQIEV